MEIEARHTELRKRLDVLGFGHPLPLGAIGIVSAILDDLIQTSEKLKCSNHQIELLHQEKAAWELDVEPYKCDNSRLLAECNGLHLELIKQQDKHILANTELRSRLRSLQSEKKQLEEKCIQVECKIREVQTANSDSVKSRKDSTNKQRKPFISTVRAGAFSQPPKCCEQGMQQPGVLPPTCRCPCNQMKQTDILNEVERLRVETKNQQGVIDALKNQVNSRDREIQRLGTLFAGGRPAAALAKDCCYRGVDVLGHDVAALQEEKVSLQQKLGEAQETHERTARKLSRLSEKNQQLERELREFENVALKVESEANLNILERERKNSDLQVKLHQSQLRVRELESVVELCSGASKVHHLSDSSGSSFACPSDVALQSALKQATEEKALLYKQLNEFKDREQTLLSDFEKVKTKYTKLKHKYATLDQAQRVPAAATNSAESQVELESLQYRCGDLEEKLRHMKDERDRQRGVVTQLKRESVDKDHELAGLKSELHAQRKTNRPATTSTMGVGRLKTADSIGSGQSSLSIQAAINRIERERDAAKCNVQQVEQERDDLREKLKLATRTQQDELAKHENLIVDYSEQVVKLEAEKRDLRSTQSAAQTKIKMLKEETRELQIRIKELENDYSKLKLTYSQLKILQNQTESALAQHQNRLLCTETQLGTAESKLHQVDSSVEDAQKEVGTLKSELSILRASNAALMREKDKLLNDLDRKTETLYTIEGELAAQKIKRKELQSTIDQMQRKLDNVSTENIHKESTLRSVSTETDTLKKQMTALKRRTDNASTENGRLSNELTDALAELTLTKRHLKDSQQEVERMKTQLREYVQEMQRAEELLFAKEREREEMLNRYKSLSEVVNVLETSNHTLEAETSEARKLLQEAEERVSSLEELVGVREENIRECEHQINALSASLAAAQSELDSVRDENQALAIDLEATKELCTKLDLQKDRLNAELAEHSDIREQLAREKGTLQKELTLTRTGDRAAVDGLQELLTASRAEVEQQRIAMVQQQQEAAALRSDIDSLRRRMADEQETARRSEALASEYSVQLQELRRRLTDERFAQIRARSGEPSEHGADGDSEDDDGNRIRRYLRAANKAREIDTKKHAVHLKTVKETLMRETSGNAEMEDKKISASISKTQKHGRNRRDRGTQKFEPKLDAPIGWKVSQYKRPAGTVAQVSTNAGLSDTDQSQGLSENGSSTHDGSRVAANLYTSLSYDVIDQLAPMQTREGSTVGASGIVKGQMDGTGSTVVIYKTAAGERLELKDSGQSRGPWWGTDNGERVHRTVPSATEGNVQERCTDTAGMVMIIDEPLPGTSNGTGTDAVRATETTIGVRTKALVKTWAEILHHQTPTGDEICKSIEDGAETMLIPKGVATGDNDAQPASPRNYRLRFRVKMPAQRNNPTP